DLNSLFAGGFSLDEIVEALRSAQEVNLDDYLADLAAQIAADPDTGGKYDSIFADLRPTNFPDRETWDAAWDARLQQALRELGELPADEVDALRSAARIATGIDPDDSVVGAVDREWQHGLIALVSLQLKEDMVVLAPDACAKAAYDLARWATIDRSVASWGVPLTGLRGEQLNIPGGVSQDGAISVARGIVQEISTRFNVNVDSAQGVIAQTHDYPYAPAMDYAAVRTRPWHLDELRSVRDALAHFAPLLGNSRAGSTRGHEEQEVRSVSAVTFRLDQGGIIPKAVSEYVGQFHNFSLFSDAEVGDFGGGVRGVESAATREIARGVLGYVQDVFTIAFDTWDDDGRAILVEHAEKPVGGALTAEADFIASIEASRLDLAAFAKESPLHARAIERLSKKYPDLFESDKDAERLAAELRSELPAFNVTVRAWTADGWPNFRNERPITQYGAINPAEDLAETAMYYFIEPDTLRARAPKRAAFFDDLVQGWSLEGTSTPASRNLVASGSPGDSEFDQSGRVGSTADSAPDDDRGVRLGTEPNKGTGRTDAHIEIGTPVSRKSTDDEAGPQVQTMSGPTQDTAPASAAHGPKRFSQVVADRHKWLFVINPDDHKEALTKFPANPGSLYDHQLSPGFQRSMLTTFGSVLDGDVVQVETLDWSQYAEVHALATSWTAGLFKMTGVGDSVGSFPIGERALAADLLDERVLGRRLIATPEDRRAAIDAGEQEPLTLLRVIDGMPIIYAMYGAEDTPAAVTAMFDDFRTAVDNARDDSDRLLHAIGQLVRRLHVLHPFLDGNGRVNIFVLMQRLLLEYGFRPVVHSDLNSLFAGGFSLDEIVEALRSAQEVNLDDYLADLAAQIASDPDSGSRNDSELELGLPAPMQSTPDTGRDYDAIFAGLRPSNFPDIGTWNAAWDARLEQARDDLRAVPASEAKALRSAAHIATGVPRAALSGVGPYESTVGSIARKRLRGLIALVSLQLKDDATLPADVRKKAAYDLFSWAMIVWCLTSPGVLLTRRGEQLKIPDGVSQRAAIYEALDIVQEINTRFNVSVHSVQGVAAQTHQYPDVPAMDYDAVRTRPWSLDELRGVLAALRHFAPLLGGRRANSTRRLEEQEIRSVSAVTFSLNDDGIIPKADGEYVAPFRNFSLFSTGEVSDFGGGVRGIESLATREIAYGLLDYVLDDFMVAFGTWHADGRSILVEHAEEPVGGALTAVGDFIASIEAGRDDLADFRKRSPKHAGAISQLWMKFPDLFESDKDAEYLAAELSEHLPAFNDEVGAWTADGWPNFRNERPITQYGATDPAEDLAESVKYYFLDPQALRERAPQRFAFLDSLVQSWSLDSTARPGELVASGNPDNRSDSDSDSNSRSEPGDPDGFDDHDSSDGDRDFDEDRDSQHGDKHESDVDDEQSEGMSRAGTHIEIAAPMSRKPADGGEARPQVPAMADPDRDTAPASTVHGPKHRYFSQVVEDHQKWLFVINPNDHKEALKKFPANPGSLYDHQLSPGLQKSMLTAFGSVLDGDVVHVATLDWPKYAEVHTLATSRTPGNFALSGDDGVTWVSFWMGERALAADLLDERVLGRRLIATPEDRRAALDAGEQEPLTLILEIDGMLRVDAICRAEDTPAVVNAMFDDFRTAVDNARDDSDRLLHAIGQLVRRLHVLHPFLDGNGRVNIFVLMQRLLLEYGFRPVVHSDLNSLFAGGFSLDEIVEALRSAQEVNLDDYLA
ncbi:hypothetical protein ABZX92_45000, partial [Lentzea sp. NPDC006480]